MAEIIDFKNYKNSNSEGNGLNQTVDDMLFGRGVVMRPLINVIASLCMGLSYADYILESEDYNAEDKAAAERLYRSSEKACIESARLYYEYYGSMLPSAPAPLNRSIERWSALVDQIAEVHRVAAVRRENLSRRLGHSNEDVFDLLDDLYDEDELTAMQLWAILAAAYENMSITLDDAEDLLSEAEDEGLEVPDEEHDAIDHYAEVAEGLQESMEADFYWMLRNIMFDAASDVSENEIVDKINDLFMDLEEVNTVTEILSELIYEEEDDEE